jgi:hypothetical protein
VAPAPAAAPAPSASAEKVAVSFSLPSGGKYDGIEVFADGASLGIKPLRERVTVGRHVFRFYKADALDLSCPIIVPDTGRSLEISGRKPACPPADISSP